MADPQGEVDLDERGREHSWVTKPGVSNIRLPQEIEPTPGFQTDFKKERVNMPAESFMS